MCTIGTFSWAAAIAAHDGVGVTEKDGHVRIDLSQDLRESRDDRRHHFGVRVTCGTELDVRSREFQVADEDVLQVVRVVLTGPAERELDFRSLRQQVDDPTRTDQVWANTEGEHHVGHRCGSVADRHRSDGWITGLPTSPARSPCRRPLEGLCTLPPPRAAR